MPRNTASKLPAGCGWPLNVNVQYSIWKASFVAAMSFASHLLPEIYAPRNPDSTPALPVEVIEQVVDFLHDDAHTLAVCSLTCRTLLLTARKHLWYSVHIHILRDRQPKTRRLAGFLALLDANPDLAPYVRSLTWTWASEFSGSSKPSWSGFKRYCLWERLPNVRALEFNCIAFFMIDPILELCHMFPHLEELVLNSISAVAVSTVQTPAPDQATRRTRNLKQLSISGAMSPRHVSALAEALLEEQLHSSLGVLDLRCTVYLFVRSGLEPSVKVFPSLLTELAPRLRSCGIPIYAVEYNGEFPLVPLEQNATNHCLGRFCSGERGGAV